MQRSPTKGNPMAGAVSVLKPPKKPCWTDFVDQHQKGQQVKEPSVEPVENTRTHGGGKSGVHDNTEGKNGIPHAVAPTKPSKQIKRVRAKIHRTRSEHTISDLPEGMLTVSLAQTKPKEFGLRNRTSGCDDRVYQEENARRCQNWLASIEACEPLDEIGYTQGKGEGVDVEIPEETIWNEKGERCVQSNTSASSSDDDVDGGVHEDFTTLVESQCDRVIQTSSKTDVHLHHKFIRKKLVSIQVDTGIE
ncbi:uncharacterized protein LOC121384186 [Gigantopelta aegis]|uniref:uncharacterized protein LOC121384186 n=1 Tax=Gigantopelta aegis TaxID=1735272 RepID=UPI001B888141|nr:uncharacterized protein LOC121384186 [Gigantopelta aegis]